MLLSLIDVRAVCISFFAYLAGSILSFAIVIQFWIADFSGADSQSIQAAAESDAGLLLWQSVIGSVLGVLAGVLLVRLNRRQLLPTAVALAGVFSAYGVLGILLHPSHPIGMQLGKLLSPFILVLLGAYFAKAFGLHGRRLNV